MRRAHVLVATLASLALLGACSEKPQTNAGGVKLDATPWSGTGTKANAGTPFTAPGWQVGDKTGWQQQLKVRAQNGQNEYTKEN